ncbi:uncharacterized protein BDV17DRAFT_296346 [Aspergillus undulatus]|uniref:uncharacterized protein n=1 Tax=Aspergillus undulatus TaxID=1810928 RepID=UPI003CCE4881
MNSFNSQLHSPIVFLPAAAADYFLGSSFSQPAAGGWRSLPSGSSSTWTQLNDLLDWLERRQSDLADVAIWIVILTAVLWITLSLRFKIWAIEESLQDPSAA